MVSFSFLRKRVGVMMVCYVCLDKRLFALGLGGGKVLSECRGIICGRVIGCVGVSETVFC